MWKEGLKAMYIARANRNKGVRDKYENGFIHSITSGFERVSFIP